MKHRWTPLLLLLACLTAAAQHYTPKGIEYVYTEASDLTLIGKVLPTEVPYARADTSRYKGWTAWENFEVRCASGIAVLFKTNSSAVRLQPVYGELYNGVSTTVLAHRGFDLYIREDGRWLWAGAVAPAVGKEAGCELSLIRNMSPGEHECLLYLPLYSELKGLGIGVEKGAALTPMESPFRHRVVIYGSSYTHGVSCSRAGMTYPAIFTRNTGIQLLSFAMSGQCKMQPYAADVLRDVPADAFVFDTFSNPSIKEIQTRLFPFIEKIQSTHPGAPLIFQRTIRRENRNFDTGSEFAEAGRIAVADSLMDIACRKYKDVYYIHPDATARDHEATVDGVHPSDYGYQRWEQSIERKVKKILRRYGIR